MTRRALRDHARAILLATVRDMQDNQSPAQQASKSKGHGGEDSAESDQLDEASCRHGQERVGSGFDIIEVFSEYRALRASVLRLWRNSNPQPDLNQINEITRFNESLDHSPRPSTVSQNASIGPANCSWGFSPTICAIRLPASARA